MRSWRALLETVHLAALGIWLGALVMTGAAAAVIFPTVKKMSPSIPEFSSYTGEHWRIVAGQPAAQIFLVCDIVQFMCFVLAALTLIAMVAFLKIPRRPAPMIVRVLGLLGAAGALGFKLLFLSPRMDSALRAFWASAKAGSNADAETFRQAFDRDHPTASSTLAVTAVFILISLVFGIWNAVTRPDAEPAAARDVPGTPPRLEVPELAQPSRR